MRYLFALLLLCSQPVLADPLAAWVTEGWTLLQQQHGDLDGDGRDDAVLVLEGTDPALIVNNAEGLGDDQLNLNPRRLLVLLARNDGYEKLLDNASFLPSRNEEESPCLADPLEEGSISVRNKRLQITLAYWLSCGSWSTSQVTFMFRLEQARLRLIGLDSGSFMRNSGERTEISYNLLTGQCKVTTGLNEFEPSRPKVRWVKKGARLYYLDDKDSAAELLDGCGT